MSAPIHFRWLAMALLPLLSGCGVFFDDLADRRAAYAKASEGPIVVAVIDDRLDGGYLDGVRLGAERINASDDKLLGRPINLLVRSGHDDLRKMLPTIRGISSNPTVTAVLGHRTSDVAIPASITYEQARVLFMPPFATSKQLTLHGFDFVLRMLPDDRRMTAQIASLASLFGYKRIAVLHDRSKSSRAIAFLFEDAARSFGIDIAFRGSFFASNDNYRELIAQLKGTAFDAVFLSTETQAGAQMLRQLRGQGIDKPVLGSDAVGTGPLAELAGDAGDLTIVPTVFSPETTTSSGQRRFIQHYRDSYGKPPNQAAAQGYDSINILATLIERSGTTDPRGLATTAHFTSPMPGITGIHAYDPDGNIMGKSYRFKILRFGRWWPLPGVTLPYLLADYRDVLARDEDTEQTSHPRQTVAPETLMRTDLPLPKSPKAFTAEPGNSRQLARQAGMLPTIRKAAPTLADDKGPEALTPGYRGINERDQAWLALAHEILGFSRLGLVISPTSTRDIARVRLARSVAGKRGFEVEVCELQAREPGPGGKTPDTANTAARGVERNATASEHIALEKAALRCYSRLARAVDSLFVTTDAGLSPTLLKRLNRALLHFGVPAFAFQRTIEHDHGLTLALANPGLDLRDPSMALRFSGVLNGLRIHELDQKLSLLPLVAMDLKAAQSLGLFTTLRELTLISDVLDSSPPRTALALAEETN